MTVLQNYEHDPSADLDYSIDWSAWLPTGDKIVASEWACDPAGPTLHDKTIDIDGKVTTVWADGPFTVGQRYMLTNHITTDQGREDDRSIVLKIKDH